MTAEEKLQAEYQSWMNSRQGPVTASMQGEYWRSKAIGLQELYQEQLDCKVDLAEARQEIERLREHAQNMVDAWDHQGFAHMQKFVDEFKKGQP